VRLLLLQVRDADDPMRAQEVECFRRRLAGIPCQIQPHSLLFDPPLTAAGLRPFEAVMVGGAGSYSCVDNRQPWFRLACRSLLVVLEARVPLFASCFGVQALAVALGGRVARAPAAELGTYPVHLTEEGRADPLLGTLPDPFQAHLGHADRVEELPSGAVRLAFTELCPVQAFRLEGALVYATQFHPELTCAENLERLQAYRHRYGLDDEQYRLTAARFRESGDCQGLLARFMQLVRQGKGSSAG
jgi:GMP synthase (glutamine-hydrolysing)